MTITYCNTYKVLQLNPSNSESMCKTTLTELLQEVLDGNAPRATFEKAFCETYYEFVYLTARKFVNDSSFNKISDKKVEISKIFEWYGEDFGNLVNFLNKYSSTKINSDAKINFVEYDWALNQ